MTCSILFNSSIALDSQKLYTLTYDSDHDGGTCLPSFTEIVAVENKSTLQGCFPTPISVIHWPNSHIVASHDLMLPADRPHTQASSPSEFSLFHCRFDTIAIIAPDISLGGGDSFPSMEFLDNNEKQKIFVDHATYFSILFFKLCTEPFRNKNGFLWLLKETECHTYRDDLVNKPSRNDRIILHIFNDIHVVSKHFTPRTTEATISWINMLL